MLMNLKQLQSKRQAEVNLSKSTNLLNDRVYLNKMNRYKVHLEKNAKPLVPAQSAQGDSARKEVSKLTSLSP